ncbi:hypothetical protein BN903_40 [Halorubrum sp. AJ67]|nr:hypothetical protein BN903_40 [Halorubrum sp. AJ67]
MRAHDWIAGSGGSDLVVRFDLVEPDTLRTFALVIVVYSSFYWLSLPRAM